MKRTRTTISVFLRIGLVVLLFALLAGVLALAFTYVGNGQRNFYVRYGNEKIISEKKGVELPKDSFSIFQCNTLTGQPIDYDVQIYLNVKNIDNFDFSVDDNRKNFRNDLTEYDCIKSFNVTKSDTHFVVFVPADLTLEKVIQAKYPDKVISGVPAVTLDAKDSFILTVTDGVEKLKTQIYFC